MKPFLPPASEFQSPTTRSVFIVCSALAGVSLVMGVVLAAAAWREPVWQTWLSLGVTTGFGAACALAARWVRAHQPARAGWAMLASLVALALAVNILVADVALLTGVLVIIIGVFSATQLLPREQLNAGLLVPIFGALVAAAAGLFAVPVQVAIPLPEAVNPLLSGLLLIGFVVLLARRFNQLPLSTKLLLALLLIVGLSLSAVSAVTQQVMRAQLLAAAGRNLQTVARAKAAEMAAVLEARVEVLRSVTLNRFLQDYAETAGAQAPASAEALQEQEALWREAVAANDPGNTVITAITQNVVAGELLEFQRQFPEHIEIFMTDKYGRTIAATSAPSGYYRADEDWWQAAMQRGIFIDPPRLDERTGLVQLEIALAIPAHDGEAVVGVLRAALSQTAFFEPLLTGRLGETGVIEVSLPDGRQLALGTGTDGEARLALAEAPEGLAQVLQLAQSEEPYREIVHGQGQVSLNSVARVVVSAEPQIGGPAFEAARGQAINELGWLVVAAQDRVEVIGLLAQAARFVLLAGLAALAVAAALVLFVAQLITRPLVRLTRVAASISLGDLTAQAPMETEDEIGSLALTFNVMTTQLRESLDDLEQRVADRTRAIATSAEVSRRLSTVLDRERLVAEVVEQVQAAFGYYHTHIYFFDDARAYLVMAGGTGEAGRQMLALGHKLPAGRGLVGRAAETNTPVLVRETAKDPNWLPNPLLPDTQAELAVPIALGDQVLGVLDVQQNTAFSLDENDVEVLQTLAYQVAIAYQNARAFSQAQRQADLEALANTIGQKLQAADSVEAALQVAAREVGRALGGARTRVRLTPQTNGRDEALN